MLQSVLTYANFVLTDNRGFLSIKKGFLLNISNYSPTGVFYPSKWFSPDNELRPLRGRMKYNTFVSRELPRDSLIKQLKKGRFT
jgi:hypothetical protein